MNAPTAKHTGLGLGLTIVALVTAAFTGLFLFGPKPEAGPKIDAKTVKVTDQLLDVLTDKETRRAIEALKAANPEAFAKLEHVSALSIQDGATQQELADLVLEGLFAQFGAQAYVMQHAPVEAYDTIITSFAEGMTTLKTTDSPWCSGTTIAEFLIQDDDRLVSALLAQFPYGSPQYDWATAFMTDVLKAAKAGQDRPRRYGRPTARDETILQEAGLALGAQQWALALQIGAFANAEGQSYAKMQDVIASVDVCELGQAVGIVSKSLPPDVRGRIWADLMPEIMVGNTPYALARVQDYFFIG